MEKAFDKQDHQAFFKALEKMMINNKLINIIKMMYKNPEFMVEVDGVESGWSKQKAGIKQGCPMSPYLFLVAMTVIFDDIKQHKELNKNLNYNSLIYEGFGPEKIAIIIEALTDNKNRTASNIRTIFQKFGGNLGESGVASHQFRQLGIIRIDKKKISDEEMLELAIKAGAEDCISNNLCHEITTLKDNFYKVKIEIEKKINEFISSGIEWLPINKISLDKEKTQSVLSFLATLEEDDDIQHVYANLETENNNLDRISL